MKLTEHQKYDLLTLPRYEVGYQYEPVLLYGRSRSFQEGWLRMYPWLCYSKELKGGLCRPCVLFAKDLDNLGQLVTCPLRDIDRGRTVCRDHERKAYHQFAMTRAESFKLVMEKKKSSIDCDLNQQKKEADAIRFKGAVSLLKITLCLSRQGLPFRSHRNEEFSKQNLSTYSDNEIPGSINSGNFLEVVKLCAASDSSLRKHLQMCPSNKTLVSKSSQNRMIELLADSVSQVLITEINASPHFSLMIDEVTDASTKEQMAVVARYIKVTTEGASVQEKFINLIECDEGTTGEAIAAKVNTVISTLQLPEAKFKAITTDGAANMSGRMKGAAALLASKYPGLVHVHCYSHVLNLAIVKACEVQDVQHMMKVVQDAHNFFEYSAKRTDFLISIISDNDQSITKTKVIDVCRTR